MFVCEKIARTRKLSDTRIPSCKKLFARCTNKVNIDSVAPQTFDGFHRDVDEIRHAMSVVTNDYNDYVAAQKAAEEKAAATKNADEQAV